MEKVDLGQPGALLPMAAVLLAAPNPLLPFWSFHSQSRWCHHGVALVSETSCNSPLANRSELRNVYVKHSPSNSIHALRKNVNSVTMPTHVVFLLHFRKCCYMHEYAYSYLLCTLGLTYSCKLCWCLCIRCCTSIWTVGRSPLLLSPTTTWMLPRPTAQPASSGPACLMCVTQMHKCQTSWLWRLFSNVPNKINALQWSYIPK